MDRELLRIIDEGVNEHKSLSEVRNELISSGFSVDVVDKALERFADRFPESVGAVKKRQSRIFLWKELLDRVGYGFAANQFINILFFETIVAAGFGGIAYFLLGVVIGLRSLLSSLLSSFVKEWINVKQLSKKVISRSGIIFGFSFLFMALAKTISSVPLFILALFLGIVGVVTYGDAYNSLIKSMIKKERMGLLLSRISQYGILITAFSLLLSGYLMDFIPETGRVFSLELFGRVFSFRAYGYLLSFEITAFAFILAGYLLSKIRDVSDDSVVSFKSFFKDFIKSKLVSGRVFFSKKIILLLTAANALFMLSQLLMNTFIGVFVFERFKSVGFGPFFNVALVFFFAVLLSVFGPIIARLIHRKAGFSPMLVFGTALMALTPFFIVWRPNLQVLVVSNTLSVLGASIAGSAQGFLTRKLLRENERKAFYSFVPFFMIVPTIIIVPLASYFAQVNGLVYLFKLIFYALILVILLYVVLVGLSEKKGFEK